MRSRPDRSTDVADRRISLGRRGEQMAADWYHEHGYRVVARNWRHARGEIDLLCARAECGGGATLVVCEVKARTSDSFGHPVEAVTPVKQARLRRLAVAFLRSQTMRYDRVRFDVVAVTGAELQVVEGAF